MSAYHQGRRAATHNEAREPPFPKPEASDTSPLAPYRAWLQGFDDKTEAKRVKREAAAPRQRDSLDAARDKLSGEGET